MLPTTPNLLGSKGPSVSRGLRQYLEQHADGLSGGIPTLSVLVGDGAAAHRLWPEQDPTAILVSWSTESRPESHAKASLRERPIDIGVAETIPFVLEQILITIDDTIGLLPSRLNGENERVSPNEAGKD